MNITSYSPVVRLRRQAVVFLAFYVFPFSIPAYAGPPARKVAKFQVKLLDGKVITNRHLQGKVAIVDIWATWCKPCIAEIPDYNAFYKEYLSKGIVFMALATDSGTVEDVRAAAKRFKMEYPVGAPSVKDLDAFGEIMVLPTTFVIDKQGTIVKEILGVPQNKHKTLRTLVDSLLK